MPTYSDVAAADILGVPVRDVILVREALQRAGIRVTHRGRITEEGLTAIREALRLGNCSQQHT